MEQFLLIAMPICAIWGIIWYFRADYKRRISDVSRPDPDKNRIKECDLLLQEIAQKLGVFARQSISKDVLNDMIETGHDASDMCYTVLNSMWEFNGLHLGDYVTGELQWPVKIAPKMRSKHTYMIGSTGSGKTTLMLHMMMQDLENGEGFALIAPDSEFFEEELLPSIPEHRLKDVVYFNPQDDERPVCFNPFEIEEGEDVVLRSEDTFTIFSRAIPTLGARAEPILRNAIYALTALPNATINDLPRLINPKDPTLREMVVACERVDLQTKEFFAQVFPTYPKDAHLPIMNRFDLILRGRVARFLSGTSISFSEIMDERKIFLANLSTGLLGDEPSKLMGQLLVSKFLTTAYKRDAIPKHQRTPFYLYVDEFQTYAQSASSTYSEILARARKYGLGLVLAHQQTKQLDPVLLEDILGNVAVTAVMRVGDRDAKRFKSVLYTGHDTEQIQIIQSRLQDFPPGRVYVKVPGQQAVLLQSPFVEGSHDIEWREDVKAMSRDTYGLKLSQERLDSPQSAAQASDMPTPTSEPTSPLQVASARVSATNSKAKTTSPNDTESQPTNTSMTTSPKTEVPRSGQNDLPQTSNPSYDEDEVQDFEFIE